MAIRFVIATVILFIISATVVARKANEINLKADVLSEDRTSFQVYFDTGSGFVGNIARVYRIVPGEQNVLRFKLPVGTERIRIDPATGPANIRIDNLQIGRNWQRKLFRVSGECLIARQQVSIKSPGDSSLAVSTNGRDSQILISSNCIPERNSLQNVPTADMVSLALISIVLSLLIILAWTHRKRTVPLLLYGSIGAMVLLVLIVSLYSRVNLHPDEFSHIKAGLFYQDHWFKLAVAHPDMLKTMIPGWGSSYLFLNDIVYSAAEKFTAVLEPLGVENHLRYRLFNFALLPILLLIFISDRRNGIWFLLAIGLSTQTWYLFSYFNGDALGMFSTMLLAFIYAKHSEDIDNIFWEKEGISAIALAF